jgi:hypothetical protein
MNEPRAFQNQGTQMPPAAPYTPAVDDYDPLTMQRSESGFNYVGIDWLGVSS